MNKLTNEQLIFVLGEIQSELDNRYEIIIDSAEPLPFGGEFVIKSNQIGRIILNNFTDSTRKRLNNNH